MSALPLLSSAPLGSVVGQSVTVTATVTTAGAGAAAPGGTVTFYDGGAMLGAGALTGGQAAFTTSGLGVGAHPITATYSGDANDLGSVAPLLSQQVNRDSTTTALTSAPNPSTIGQAVTFTATVAVAAPGVAAPAGQLTFLDGSATLGTGTLNSTGVVTFTTTTLSVGAHSVTAVYGGDTNDSASTSAAVSQRVAPKPLQLVLSVTTSPSGPVTTGSVVTVNGALTNHTAAAQSVTLKAALVYVSGHTRVTASVSNVSLQLAPSQTVGRTFGFRVQSSYPRGTYTLTLTATDAGGDTDSGVASLTIV